MSADINNLQLITLNIWGGRILSPLMNFIKTHADTHFFCLQEVYSRAKLSDTNDSENPPCLNIQEKIADLLHNHRGYFRPVVNGVYGLSIFAHNNIKILEEGEHTIYSNANYTGFSPAHSRILQWIKFSTGERDMTIMNVHGLWNGHGKTDSPERINQSNIIKSFVDMVKMPVILCGDFNILPETKSIKILSEGMQDFIKRDSILSTRSSLYKKSEKHADYIFASKDIEVTQFKVLNEEVSDHLPLYLEFLR